MSTYANTLVTLGWPTGYAASLTYAVKDADGAGTTRIAATGTGIAEVGGGVYDIAATLDTAWGNPLKIIWTDGTDTVEEVFANVAPSSISASSPSDWAGSSDSASSAGVAKILKIVQTRSNG